MLSYSGAATMKTNRYIPAITAVVAFGLALWLATGEFGWLKLILGALLFALGWFSIKVALFASNQEISELTGSAPMSEETKSKYRDLI